MPLTRDDFISKPFLSTCFLASVKSLSWSSGTGAAAPTLDWQETRITHTSWLNLGYLPWRKVESKRISNRLKVTAKLLHFKRTVALPSLYTPVVPSLQLGFRSLSRAYLNCMGGASAAKWVGFNSNHRYSFLPAFGIARQTE